MIETVESQHPHGIEPLRPGLGRTLLPLSGNWMAAGLIAAHAFLGVLYAWTIPIWEGNDEPSHFSFVRHVAEHGTLPVAVQGDNTKTLTWQYNQPPLYYLAVAPSIAWMDLPPEAPPQLNIFAAWGDTEQGANIFLPTRSSSSSTSSIQLAVRLARAASVFIGTLGVAVTYLLARSLFPEREYLAVAALAVFAFAPQPLYIGSIVNNDIGIVALSAVTLLFACRAVSRSSLLELGGAVGTSLLALFTKFSGIALIPMVAMASVLLLIDRARRQKRQSAPRTALAAAGLVALILLLLAGVWTQTDLGGRFEDRFGGLLSHAIDLLADSTGAAEPDPRPSLATYAKFTFISFWAAFGWSNVLVDTWLYGLFLGVSILAVFGMARWLARESGLRRRVGILLAVYLSAYLAVVLTRVVAGSFFLGGRYLLPIMPALAILLTYAVASISRGRLQRVALGGFALGFMALAVTSLIGYILPAYSQPPEVSPAQVEATGQPVDASFGGAIRLVAYETQPARLFPGSEVSVTLYLQSLEQVSQNYVMTLQLLSPGLEVHAIRNGHPGHGNYPTSLWRPGEIRKDTYRLTLDPEFPAPAYAQIKVAFFELDTREHLAVQDGQGAVIGEEVIFGRLPVDRRKSTSLPPGSIPVHYEIGDFASLTAYSVDWGAPSDAHIQVALFWKAAAATALDYTMFVHLRDEDGEMVAQSDNQPRKNYYPTSLWRPGEIVDDVHTFTVPEGRTIEGLQLRVGMYLLETLQRLAVVDEAGRPLPNDEIVLALPTPD